MENKNKILEMLKGYSVGNKQNANQAEISAILKDVLANPSNYVGGDETDLAINKELIRILQELKEKDKLDTDKKLGK